MRNPWRVWGLIIRLEEGDNVSSLLSGLPMVRSARIKNGVLTVRFWRKQAIKGIVDRRDPTRMAAYHFLTERGHPLANKVYEGRVSAIVEQTELTYARAEQARFLGLLWPINQYVTARYPFVLARVDEREQCIVF